MTPPNETPLLYIRDTARHSWQKSSATNALECFAQATISRVEFKATKNRLFAFHHE
jgi:hypothetical protein